MSREKAYFLNANEMNLAREYFKLYPNAHKLRKGLVKLPDGRSGYLSCSVISTADKKLYALCNSKLQYNNINAVLGKGSFGRVKLAQSLEDGTIIAAKIQKVSNPENFSDIRKEEEMQYAVNQYLNNVSVNKKGNFKIETKHYTFSKFIEGHSLAKHFSSNPNLSLQERLKVMLVTLKSVKELHDKGIVHGDLSFNNILYNPKTQEATIIDFGFSGKMSPGASSIKLPFPLKYHPNHYFAPECTSGRASYASDIHSLGRWLLVSVAKENRFLKEMAEKMTLMDSRLRIDINTCIKNLEQELQHSLTLEQPKKHRF